MRVAQAYLIHAIGTNGSYCAVYVTKELFDTEEEEMLRSYVSRELNGLFNYSINHLSEWEFERMEKPVPKVKYIKQFNLSHK
jgi:hypothetical protein